MSKVIRIGTVGDIINTLIKQFENNNFAEICVTFKGKDGSNYSTWSNNENFYQRLGKAELAGREAQYQVIKKIMDLKIREIRVFGR